MTDDPEAPAPKRTRKARPLPPVALTIAIDGEDLAWLKAEAYPLGVSAEDYLRMFVRQSRLGLAAMGVRGARAPLSSPPAARPQPYVQPYQQAGLQLGRPSDERYDPDAGDAAVDALVAEAAGQAPEAPVYSPLADLAGGAQVIPLTARPQRPDGQGPVLKPHQAF